MNRLKKINITRQQRTVMFALPIIVLPLFTIGYWGWDRIIDDEQIKADSISNRPLLAVPQAELSQNKELDKMDLYAAFPSEDQYDRQGVRKTSFDFFIPDSLGGGIRDGEMSGSYPDVMQSNLDERALILQNRLEVLQHQLTNEEPTDATDGKLSLRDPNEKEEPSDVDRLQLLMNQINGGGSEDPEMQQLSGMLDKIIDIQHPERIQQAIKENNLAHIPPVYQVQRRKVGIANALNGDSSSQASGSGFYGLVDSKVAVLQENNAILAEVHGEQTLVSGSTLKLSLCEDVELGGQLVEANHFLNGVVSLQGDRLHVKINTVRLGQSILPVELELYDLDGIAGVFIPGSSIKDVGKGSIDQGIQSVNMSSLDESLSAKAVDAGIGAAKRLLSLQVKTVKVTLKDGYRVLLKQK